MVTALTFCASYVRVWRGFLQFCVHARVLFLLILTFKHIYIVHKQANAKTLEFQKNLLTKRAKFCSGMHGIIYKWTVVDV